MKYALALAAVLATVAVVCNSSVIKAGPRTNLNVGFATTGDRLLNRTYVQGASNGNNIQYKDVAWKGNTTNVISAVQATEIGDSHDWATAWITAGGLGQNNVTVRFQGFGFNYRLDIWGH